MYGIAFTQVCCHNSCGYVSRVQRMGNSNMCNTQRCNPHSHTFAQASTYVYVVICGVYVVYMCVSMHFKSSYAQQASSQLSRFTTFHARHLLANRPQVLASADLNTNGRRHGDLPHNGMLQISIDHFVKYLSNQRKFQT